MKKFINLLCYSLFIVLVILYLLKFVLIENYKLATNENIILGDSHVEHVSMKNLTNFSTAGAYMKTLFKGIKDLNVENKKVFISVGPHTFADFRTSRYSSKEGNKYLLSTMDTLIPNRLNTYHTWWRLPLSGKELFRISRLYTPKPVYDAQSNLSDTLLDKTISRHYPASFVNDTTERKWFNQIVNYVHENGGNVYLIEMPIHNDYLKKIPKKYLNRYDSVTSCFENVIRFGHQPDSLFRDGDHLLPKYQSKFLSQILNEYP